MVWTNHAFENMFQVSQSGPLPVFAKKIFKEYQPHFATRSKCLLEILHNFERQVKQDPNLKKNVTYYEVDPDYEEDSEDSKSFDKGKDPCEVPYVVSIKLNHVSYMDGKLIVVSIADLS